MAGSSPRRASSVRALLALVAVVAGAGVLAPARRAAADPPLWQRVADPDRERFDRLVQKARDLLAEGVSPSPAPSPAPSSSSGEPGRAQLADRLASCEARLHEALALEPFEFSTLFLLAEVQSLRQHPAAAVITLERAEPLARLPGQKVACWFRLGLERSRLGRYREALASYDHQLALGETEAAAYANAAELLMGLGRLRESEDRYREAIRIDERAADRRGHEQGLAFSYYGLGVALDRGQQDVASREAIGRAVALDPTGSLLRLAQRPNADFSFIPDGDVYYYIGVAAELAGKRDDALAAFQEYVGRQPLSLWTARADMHIAALAPSRLTGSPPPPSAPAPRHRWRAVAVATVRAEGPVPAPVIDAALKQHPPAWSDCFADAAPARGHDTVRFTVEVDLDPRGAVAQAVVKLAAPFDAGPTAACVEAAVRAGLAVTAPAHAKATRARIEVLLANGDAGGL